MPHRWFQIRAGAEREIAGKVHGPAARGCFVVALGICKQVQQEHERQNPREQGTERLHTGRVSRDCGSLTLTAFVAMLLAIASLLWVSAS